MTQYEQDPLFYQDVLCLIHSDQEGVDSEHTTLSHEEIQAMTCRDTRSILGRLSASGQIEEGMYALPILNADGTLQTVTRTFGGIHRSAYVGSNI